MSVTALLVPLYYISAIWRCHYPVSFHLGWTALLAHFGSFRVRLLTRAMERSDRDANRDRFLCEAGSAKPPEIPRVLATPWLRANALPWCDHQESPQLLARAAPV